MSAPNRHGDALEEPSIWGRRRQSIGEALSSSKNKENGGNERKTMPPSPSSTQKSRHRTNLGAPSSYYFSGLPKTPVQKAASARKKLSASLQKNDASMDESFDLYGKTNDYNGTLPAMETSYFSSSSSSDGSSPGGDALNQSVLSDTTELTASNYVFSTASRQRWSIGASRRNSEKIIPQASKDLQASQETRPPLRTANANIDRRKTLPPGITSRATTTAAQKAPQRRDSLQGFSPASDSVKDKAMGFLAVMKERRLSRQSTGSRVSIGSVVSKKGDEKDTSTMSLGLQKDILSELSKNAEPSPSKANIQSPSEKDDDSIVSAGSLFDDLMSTEKSREETASDVADFTMRPSVASDIAKFGANEINKESPSLVERNISGAVLEEDGGSITSDMLEDSVLDSDSVTTDEAVGFSTQTSQVGTPVELQPIPTKSPRPLPDSVAFKPNTSDSPANRPPKSPLRNKSPSSAHKTPQSPDRAPTSPFQKTNSSRKLTLLSAEKDKFKHLSKSPGRIIDSPARNTRSAQKKRKLNESIELADDESVTKKGRKSSVASLSLNSSFRKGISRHQGSARKVAFGSPEVVEFHATSPSMSMTPMPKSSANSRYSIPDDTVEIEADMNALLNNMNNPDAVAKLSSADTSTSTAGSTPFASRHAADMEFEEATRELETNLDDVFNEAEAKESLKNDSEDIDDAASDMSDDSQARHLVGEHTEALEVSMSEMLAKTIGSESQYNNEKISKGDDEEEDHTVELEANMGALLMAADTPEQQKEVEHTVELEPNMGALLMAAEDTPEHKNAGAAFEIVMADDDTPVAGRCQRRSSVASRRFSLATKSRLSLDDPYPNDTEQNQSQVLTQAEEQEEPEENLDITLGDLIHLAEKNLSPLREKQDVFSETSTFLQENRSVLLAEALNTYLMEICENFDKDETSSVDPDFINQLPDEDQKKILALQKSLRSDNKAMVEKHLSQLLKVARECETVEWEEWLLETVVQMEEHFALHTKDLQSEREKIVLEIQRIDDAECVLSAAKARSVQRARRQSLQRRKVSSLFVCS